MRPLHVLRWFALALLWACVASEAAPPVSGGGGGPRLIDDDTFATASATTAASSESIKAYVDANAGAGLTPAYATYATCVASTPDAVGDWCQSTDSPYRLESTDGATWDRTTYPGVGLVTPPPSADWTAYNSGSVAAVGGVRVLTMPAETTAGGWRGERRTMPATPYYVEMVLVASYTGTGSLTGAYGGMFTNGTGFAGALVGGGKTPQVIRQTNATTFAGTDADVDGWPRNPTWLKLVDDGTLRHFYIGDGAGGWSEVGTGFGRTVTITATDIGWTAIGHDAEATKKIALVHWKTGTP